MAYPISVRERAIELRNRGFSIKEISHSLSIAKSTSSAWLRDIFLDERAQERLRKRQILGQYKSLLIFSKRREDERQDLINKSRLMLASITVTKDYQNCYVR